MIRALIFLLFSCWIATSALAKPRILAQVSQTQVDINTNFSGASILLFGTVQGVPKSRTPDVIVILRGPNTPMTVRHKSRVVGIWMNSRSVNFRTSPSFYVLKSTGPLDKIADRTWRAVYEIGIDWLHFTPVEGSGSSAQKIAEFRDGFVTLRQRLGLFSENTNGVELVDNTLFLTRLDLPARVPVGKYRADVFLFLDGKFIDKTELAILVEKSGLERSVYDIAHKSPFLYGLFAVLVALAAGWIASLAVQRK